MGKATNVKFCTHILSVDGNKSPLQISGKVAGCVVRTLETFQGTHLLGASRGLLCDSSAVLYRRASYHRPMPVSYPTPDAYSTILHDVANSEQTE